jgi:hypothetical protein
MEAGFSQLSQTMENRELYAAVIIMALAIVLMSGSVEVAIAMAAILTAAMYKLMEPDYGDGFADFQELQESYAENNLLEPYLTPEQRAASVQPFAAAPKTPPKTPPKAGAGAKAISKKPEPAACAELLDLLDSRTDDGNINYMCHAKRKFRGREPRKRTTRDTIMRWVEDEPSAEENRHWWGAHEQ